MGTGEARPAPFSGPESTPADISSNEGVSAVLGQHSVSGAARVGPGLPPPPSAEGWVLHEGRSRSFTLLDIFQGVVGEWLHHRDPESTPSEMVERLEEAAHAVGSWEQEDDAADCLLLLLQYCHHRKVSLWQIAQERFAEIVSDEPE